MTDVLDKKIVVSKLLVNGKEVAQGKNDILDYTFYEAKRKLFERLTNEKLSISDGILEIKITFYEK